ncbi:M48 family metalloprotease [Streptomyces sp. NBC_00647]|uniref:M48 family metalloprotease n=1 Tax=Streptomyces sp. NBC_00647 TaxID=2975796 RepID=UPI003248464E
MRKYPPARPGRSWGPPPWLWLTLLLFLVQVPALTGHALGVGAGLVRFGDTGRGSFVTATLSLVQLLPLFFLLAAVLALFAPRARCRVVERRYGLLAPDDPLMAPPAEPPGYPGRPSAPDFATRMTAFVNEHAPGVQLRLSTQDGLSARVYPGSWRTTRIGVFAPLVHLWRTDTEAARAVLLHELGHLRQGEQHVTGLGGPLTALVRAWPHVLVAFVVLPVTLLFVTGDATARLTLAEVVLVLFSVPKVLLLVVGALWSAELGADRFAARAAGADHLVRALRRLEQGDHGGLARLHHPPARMRIRCVSRGGTTRVRLLLTLLWPLALLAQLPLAMLGALPAYALLGAESDRATRQVLALAHESLATEPAWWATLAVTLVWPLVTGVRPVRRDAAAVTESATVHTAAVTTSAKVHTAAVTTSARVHTAAVLLPAVLLLVGLLPLVSRPSGGVFPDERAGPATPATRAPGGGAPAGVAPTACPSRGAPRDPTRPPGLPVFTPETPPPSRDSAPDRQRGARTFRTLDVTAADALSGTRDQAQDVGDRLRGARWTLHDDGTLTADRAGVPLLRTTSAGATTRLLTGQRTERTDVSATTTWMEARLVGGAGRTARLDLVRAATRDMRAVVDCREFTSTSSTAQRLSLTLVRE